MTTPANPPRRLPWRQYAAIPFGGAILAVGLAVGQYRAASSDGRLEQIAEETAIRAVEAHNSGRDRKTRLRESMRVEEMMGSASMSGRDAERHDRRGHKLLFCAAFLSSLALWLYLKGNPAENPPSGQG